MVVRLYEDVAVDYGDPNQLDPPQSPLLSLGTLAIVTARATPSRTRQEKGEEEVKMLLVLMTLIAISTAQGAGQLSLDGTWQGCRTASADAPGDDATWTAIEVPARQNLRYGLPFVWYRRSFDVPAEFAGRRLFLRFEGVQYVSEVHVNGRRVGGYSGGFEPFECNVTDAVWNGRPNELLVRVQDVTGVIDGDIDHSKVVPGGRLIDQVSDAVLYPIGSSYHRTGIWQPVSLVARNDLYVEDVRVVTSVREKRVSVEVTVRNLSTRAESVDVTAEVDGASVDLGRKASKVPAAGMAKLRFEAAWSKPRLWCPDDPHLYHLDTVITANGRVVDKKRARFGFREFWIDGEKFLLNGVPVKFLGTAGHPSRGEKASLEKSVAAGYYRRLQEAGCNAMRLHANVWPRSWFEAADETGMLVIMESALFCYARNYAMTRPEFWENYHEHLRAMVKVHQNHPSVVMTSLENEILHCGGARYAEDCERRLAEAGRFVKELDPTRPIMYDGDADPGGVADVVNLHYPVKFDKENLWPNAAWWLAEGKEVGGWPRTFWTWDRKKPLYMGEFLHLQHYTQPDNYTALLGDSAYHDLDDAMARCKADAWAMQIQAYRAADVSGLCPWVLTETGEFPSDANPRYLAVKRMYAANGAYIREYDSRFFGGETVRRTVDLYNDTMRNARLKLLWKLTVRGQTADSGSRSFNAKPADHFTFPIEIRMPKVVRRPEATLELVVESEGEEVFRDTQSWLIFPRRPLRVPDGVRLALYEGSDRTISTALAEAGTKVERVSDLARLPDGGVLVIGPHALDDMKAATNRWVVGDASSPRQALGRFVRKGGGVVVLEQDGYGGLLPATLDDRGCTVAFDRIYVAESYPKWWRGDHVVARKTIAKPTHGRFRTLLDSGGPKGLVNVALLEWLHGNGSVLMSQLAIGEKLGTEPAAAIELQNLIARASHPNEPVQLGVVQGSTPIVDALNEIDACFVNLSGKLVKTDLGAFGCLLVEAECPEVAGALARLRAFAETGGTIVVHGLTPTSAKRLGGLFPEAVTVQRSSAVPVTIARPGMLLAGLSNQELCWYESRKGMHYRQRTPLSTHVCSHALILGLPDPESCHAVEAETMKVVEGAGRAYGDHVSMHARGLIETIVEIPEAGEYAVFVRGRGTPLEGEYPRIRVTVDGRFAGNLTLESEKWDYGATVIEIEKGERRIGLEFVNDAWNPETREDRNVWMDKLLFGPTRPARGRRLLSPAALVTMPLGRGRLFLDQVNWDVETRNVEKARRYLSWLLTSLGVAFRSPMSGVTVDGAQLTPAKGVKLYRGENGVASLAANGTLYFDLVAARAGRYELAVNASGTQAGGEFPNIRIDLGGKPAGNLQLQRDGWRTLRMTVDLPGGTSRIGLSFTNDFYDPPEDRNLRIRSVTVRSVD